MSAIALDTSILQELRSHIEKLTHSGQKKLDEKLLKALKNICKQSDKYVERGYQMILHDLQKEHSEIRYSALQIADELFRRSRCFRELLLADMHQFMELTLEINKDNPLPLPKAAAKSLKKKALQIIHEWNKKFGEKYKRLDLAHKFLKNCLKVDFKELEIQSSIEHQRQMEMERKEKEILERRERKIFKEIEESRPDIEQAVTSMKNCLSLLLPHPKEFFVDADDKEDISLFTMSSLKDKITEGDGSKSAEKSENVNESSSDSDSETETDERIDLRAYGVLNPYYSIEIDLKPDPEKVKVTEENVVIAENAKDLFVILSHRYLNDVKKWIRILTKTGSSDKVKSLIDLKQEIEAILSMYAELNLQIKPIGTEESDSDTSDLEEVKPKEDFEETVSEPLPSTSKGIGLPQTKSSTQVKNTEKVSDWSIISQENDIRDPTSALSTYVSMKCKTEKDSSNLPSTSFLQDIDKPLLSKRKDNPASSSVDNSRKSKLLAIAPKIPFDLDLYHWENENIPSAVMKRSHPDAHNFWSTSTCDDEDDSVPKELSGTSRVIEFSGKFNPVKWTCRAPISSGKLCPRRDRTKCPFHGPIVPRDEMGNVCAVDGKLPVVEPKKPEVPDWQDPQLLKEIESQTGIDLTMPEKGKGKKKKPKYPGLTDVKASQNTTYNRLSKKIFKKSSMKRVASTLDAIDHKKFRDKFGDQFNYF